MTATVSILCAGLPYLLCFSAVVPDWLVGWL
jgi:hypothetical protein